MAKQLTELQAIIKYKECVLDLLHLSFPYLSAQELEEAVDYSIVKHCKDGPAHLENNYTKKEMNTTVLQMTEYIIGQEPIITSQGVLFKKHGAVPNPLYKLIETFIQERVTYKNEMFKYPKGSEQFQKYNMLQLLAKINCNALYGVLGMYSSVFYNIFVAPSITSQGKSCISSAILLAEAFLSNNVKFGSLNEIITFINNVIHETRVYNDSDVLDENITLEESFFKIISTCGFNYIPSEKDMIIIWEMMSRLSQEDLNRLYYKNNLYSFMDNSCMKKAILVILQRLERPFMNPNKPPKEIAVELDELYKIMFEYVYYGYQYIDRLDRVENMIRNVSIITDTDSTIISFDAWYRYILADIYDKPMKIKHMAINPFIHIDKDEFGDWDRPNPIEYVETEYDYDFYEDEVIEKEKLINPFIVCPQEGLRYSIINIISHILGKLFVDYMIRYTMNSNSYAPDRKCLLVLKNEFLFKRVLNTNNKKNYADIQEIQEGTIIPTEEGLDVKGLPINKSTLPKPTSKRLKKILYETILNAETIDQIDVLKALKIMEKDIYNSLVSGNKDYYKPVRIKSTSGYDDPMGQFGYKAAYVYNKLKLPEQAAIDLDSRNSLDVIKVNINRENAELIKEEYPDLYINMINLIDSDDKFKEITMIGLPTSEPVPDWVLNYIDYNAIITDNMINFPLESIGLFRSGKTIVNTTNILKI